MQDLAEIAIIFKFVICHTFITVTLEYVAKQINLTDWANNF